MSGHVVCSWIFTLPFDWRVEAKAFNIDVMAGVNLTKAEFPAGGGAFELPRLALGVFLVDQPSHCLAVGSDKRRHFPLTKFDGWILPAECNGFCEYDAKLEALIIDFDQPLLEEVGLPAGRSVAPYAGRLDPLILQLALGAETFLAGTKLYKETMSRAFAAQLVQATTPQPQIAAKIEDGRLRQVIDYIHDHLSADLSLKELASLAAMSPFHFSRSFKAATGYSPLQYVIGCRIAFAKVLLKTTKLTVSEIAYRSGYDDAARFSQHFKKRVGASPSTFRGA